MILRPCTEIIFGIDLDNRLYRQQLPKIDVQVANHNLVAMPPRPPDRGLRQTPRQYCRHEHGRVALLSPGQTRHAPPGSVPGRENKLIRKRSAGPVSGNKAQRFTNQRGGIKRFPTGLTLQSIFRHNSLQKKNGGTPQAGSVPHRFSGGTFTQSARTINRSCSQIPS